MAGLSNFHWLLVLWPLVPEVPTVAEKKPTFTAFVDIKKCFPSVNRSAFFKHLLILGFSRKFVKSLAAFYWNSESKLRIGILLTAAFLVNTWLSEGRVLSPPLFSLILGLV